LSIRVDLAEGHGEQCWPRPGRIFAAARSHTFKQLADAIDDAFARWDRSHLQEFTLADGRRLCDPDPDWEIEERSTVRAQREGPPTARTVRGIWHATQDFCEQASVKPPQDPELQPVTGVGHNGGLAMKLARTARRPR
jgi:hypothetical protein